MLLLSQYFLFNYEFYELNELVLQLSIINYQLSTVNSELSIVHCRLHHCKTSNQIRHCTDHKSGGNFEAVGFIENKYKYQIGHNAQKEQFA